MTPKRSEAAFLEDRFSVYPSDVGQSILRIVLVFGIGTWSYLRTQGGLFEVLSTTAHFQFALAYFSLSVALFFWTKFIVSRVPVRKRVLIITRVFGIFTDISAVSIYTALSGPEGIILYPIYLTSSIGYGYRFGVRYLYLALAVSAASFSLVLGMNPFIAGNRSLIAAFYLGIIIVPFYAAVLLRQHQEVLSRLKSVNAARSRFIANMSHELRTPLHAIISIADLLRESDNTTTHARRADWEKLQMIRESGEHLLTLVNRVLDVASAESGLPSAVETEMVDLYSVIFSALRICQATAENKGLKFAWQFDVAVPSKADTSGQRIKEILINTVGNAVKYTPEGNVVVRVFRVDGEPSASLRIEIEDTGIGISPKLLPTIFEPFTLGDDSASRRYSGTGLGLTLTKRYVDDLRGTINFAPRASGGTICSISLPLFPPTRNSSELGESPGDPLRALIYCEDVEFVRRFCELAKDYLECCALALVSEATSEEWLPDVVVIEGSDEAARRAWSADAETRFPNAVLAVCVGPPRQTIEKLPVNVVFQYGDRSQIRALAQIARAANQWSANSADADDQEHSSASYKILVADDNPTNLRTAKLALAADGHKVQLADGGESALSQLEMEAFDLALIDLHMPNMSGIEVLQLYQYLFTEPRTPIVILTADVTSCAREQALAAGATAVLSKPLRLRELRDAVAHHAAKGDLSPFSSGESLQLPSPETGSRDRLIDTSVIREFLELGIDADEIRDMIGEFAADTNESIDCLQGALAQRDIEAIRAHLHSLKGSCGTVGATALLGTVERCRIKIDNWEHEDCEEVVEHMRSLLNSSVSEVAQILREVS